MTRDSLVLLAAGGSLALLLGAFGFQHIGGLAPCEMCLWQRWPHAVAVIIGLGALLALRGPLLPVLGALAALTTGAIGVYHTGVERKWWQGPDSCTGGGEGLGAGGGDLLDFDAPTAIALCDEVPWEMFGLSMATYNALIAAGLAVLWLWAARLSRG